MRSLTLMIILFSLFLLSCQQHSQSGKEITRRIQYDVDIKSPDVDMDWWVQNLEGAQRESLLRQILESAYEGKVRTWDVFHNEMRPEQIRAMGNRADTITIQRPEPPYELYDTVLTKTLNINDISRIRFLEEWYIDPASLRIEKKVIGLCPMLESYSPEGHLRGYMPMFWVYFDAAYPGVFKAVKP
jgi:hypothetical protein